MKQKRIYFVDNLKILLTSLVVLHHVAITYGSRGSWYYYEHTGNGMANDVLSLFTSMNQMYFMGLFFLISGYFTPSSFNHKGFKAFLRDRLIRLGIPLVIFMFTIIPVLEYIKYTTTSGNQLSFWHFYNVNVLQLRNLPAGHLWFIEVLLIFSIIYAVIRFAMGKVRNPSQKTEAVLNNFKVLIFVIALALFTFVTRIYFKMGEEVFHLQLAYFPQYISLFIIGIIAYHNKWFVRINPLVGRTWTVVAIIDFLACEIGLGSLGFYNNIEPFSGGGTLQSLFLSFHQAFFCVGMCISLLYIFRKRYNVQGPILKAINGDTYTVYVIHAPIAVFTAMLFKGIQLHPLIKFAVVSSISLVLCFALSHFVLRKLAALWHQITRAGDINRENATPLS